MNKHYKIKKMAKNKNNITEKLDIPEELWEIYKRPPESRTQNNINYLYQECKKLKCFKNILTNNERGQLMIREIISRVEFSLFQRGKQIYSVNEPIINMFFIFEGEINVYKKQINSSKRIPSPLMKKVIKDQKEIDYILSKGDEYGKEDIKKEKRDVQVESRTKCIVGFLSIQDWIFIFEKTNLLERNDVINFFSKINIFKDINIMVLNNLCDLIKIKNIPKFEFLVKKGEPFNNIYIIRYGSFKVFFDTKIKITTDFDLTSFSNQKKRAQSANINYKFEKNCFEKLQYQIITLFHGEFIGDIEYYFGKEKYVFFAKCTSEDTQVIEISLKTFESICSKRMKIIFLKEIKNKINYFEKRCNDIKKVHKNKNFGLKSRYKLMIINSIEEQNKDEFEKMENKTKYRNQSNDKKLNTVVTSFTHKTNTFLTETNKDNNALSLLFEKRNKSKRKSICLNNIKNYNTIKRQTINKSPMNTCYSFSSKKTPKKILSFNKIKKKSYKNNIYSKIDVLNEQKIIKNHILFNKNLKEIITNNNNLQRNKSQKINKNLLINKNKKYNSILTENNIYNFRNMQSFLDINKNFLVKHNSREIKNNLKTIFSYKHKH